MTPEGRVKALVKRALKTLGRDCKAFMPVQTGFGTPGLDFHLCVRGMTVLIETKKPGGELSPLQIATKQDYLDAGGIVLIVWDEASLSTAMEIINGIQSYGGHHFATHTFLTEEARRAYEQHLRAVVSGKAPKSPAGGDHGAPRKPPRRQSKPRTGGPHQDVAGGEVDGEEA